MCVIFVAYGRHPEYPLILLANRDEYYTRPTLVAGPWEDAPEIFGGRDLVGGGTWLAVNKNGRFAAVTNYRDPSAPAGDISRGKLVADYLKSRKTPRHYLNDVREVGASYSGFNLLVGEISAERMQLLYCSNRIEGIVELSHGIYGLSNHLLDTPWPKVMKGKERLKCLLEGGDISDDRLLEMLADETIADEAELPSTGIPFEAERALSAIFIRTPGYGTRCSTLLKFDSSLNWSLSERVAVP
jgi:uncharacterized protein with NRDE domain